MLRLNHYTGYSQGRRFLTIRVDPEYPIDRPNWRIRGYELHLFPHSSQQIIRFQWNGHWQYVKPYKTNTAMGLMIEVQYDPVPRSDGRWVANVWNQIHIDSQAGSTSGWSNWPPPRIPWTLPNADWGALLQIGKMVAAGRAEPLIVMGWIEDRLPDPWSQFASPDPIEAFRALSPIPLYED